MNMEFLDKDNRRVILTYKTDRDRVDGNHVLAIPTYHNQLLFTRHKQRGIEFPGGKKEADENSVQAINRELFEETGGKIDDIHYIAQYQVMTKDGSRFVKDVFFVNVTELVIKQDYLETAGPVTYKRVDDIPPEERSFLLEDGAILQCLERVYELGLYKS